MKTTSCTIFTIALFFSVPVCAQDVALYVPDAIKSNRTQQHRNIINNLINKNLSLQLTDSTEEFWEDAFYALELINYKSMWVDGRIRMAFDSIEKRSSGFQRSLLELAYANYKGKFVEAADGLMQRTRSSKIFALAAEYYIASLNDPNAWNKVVQYFSKRADKDDHVPVYYGLLTGLISGYSDKESVSWLINNVKSMVPRQVLLISFQRKNRNFPGLAVIRDASGNFIKDETGNIFSVPQLARSMSNLPFYLTNGNTPQGLFRMNGFDVSKSMAIGPTSNIQLMMPYETTPQVFLKDPSIADTTWSEEVYKRLLPENLKEYLPLFESFYASKAGRSEIIAHGTTINPNYYLNNPYYPISPTEGCLCTKEIWSDIDGKRIESDQQKLVNALRGAGGANGYCVVIELDDQQQPLTLEEIMPYINKAIAQK
ncbi:MAG TPA: hypothetical protein VK489_06365 [Ferruginibacter sp.]|nr:hypothetical protein [Ferruginibacter sp.]